MIFIGFHTYHSSGDLGGMYCKYSKVKETFTLILFQLQMFGTNCSTHTFLCKYHILPMNGLIWDHFSHYEI